jgi:starch synthase
VTPEAYPLVKTGGLADVSAALPAALRALGADVRLLLPGLPAVLGGLAKPRTVSALAGLPGGFTGRLLRGEAPNGVPVYAVDVPALYDRPGNPYLGPDGLDWPDNHLRFAALAAAARRPLGRWRPDIVHGHDWQSGLAPAYLALAGAPRPATILTVHNMAYQGLFPAETLAELQLPPASFSMSGVEYWGKVGFLKAGLFYADRITTVSPTYTREIQGPDEGMGLEGLLAGRAGDLVGILNGVDTAVWDPATDPALPARYGATDLAGKAACKAALQAELGLARAPSRPLFIVVSRLSPQKGLDLVLGVAERIVDRGGQLALLGAGDTALEVGFRSLAQSRPGGIAVTIGYDEALAHRMQGGGDAILVPSRSEPCGLTQMYGLRYGTLPVVRRTGGLADTVVDAGDLTLATGFVFGPPTIEALWDALEHAFLLWDDRPLWAQVQHRAMAQDFSWAKSARQYLALYRSLAPAPAA